MARISIEPVKAKKALTKEQELEKILRALRQETLNVRSGLSFKISGQEAISARLRDAADQLGKEASSTYSLYSGLEQIIARYEQTENANVERLGAEKTSVQQTGGTQTPIMYPTFDVGELLQKEILKLLGPFGTVITGIGDLWNGDLDKLCKDLIDLIGDTGSVILDEPKAEWFKELFGIGADGFKRTEEAPEFLDELFDFSTEGKTVSTVASWAASFLGSFISNADEFGADSWTQGRFWEETLVETGIDMVEGAIISTVVGTAAVALFGNPVSLGVAAATVATTFAVDWALDSIVTWATGGAQTSWTEWASDGICDGLEWAGNKITEGVDKFVESVGPVVTKTADAVKDGIGYVADKVSDGWNSMKEGFSNLFNSCRWSNAAVNGGW